MALLDPLINPTNLIASILLTLSPIIILFIPYLFTRRKNENVIAIIFNRGFIGFFVFYLAYFVFPSILNYFVPNPEQYMSQEYYPLSGTGQWSTIWDASAIVSAGQIYIPVPLLIKYLFQHFLNSVVIFLTYPIIILAFVFGISPFISMTIMLYQTWNEKRNERKPLRRRIRQNLDEIRTLKKELKESTSNIEDITNSIDKLEKENQEIQEQAQTIKSVVERLNDIQYELESSPFQEITRRVKEKNWDNEKELLKVLIAILPISLFLLMTILQLLGETENPSLLQGTSMGWFLEIFFAYIASLVFSVYLIKVSRLSRKGKFLGNQLYVAMVQSLSTVGAFMSVLAVILFLVQYIDQIFVVSYFVIYFIMVSVFFVLFLDIFEPFSIFLLIKIIETFKNLKMALKRVIYGSIAKTAAIGIVVGFLLALGFLAYRVFIVSVFINHETVQYRTFFWLTLNYSSFLISAALLLFVRRWNWSIISNALTVFVSIFVVSLLIFEWYNLELYTLLGFPANSFFPSVNREIILITPFTTVASTFAGIGKGIRLEWLTSIWKAGTFNELQFIIPELRSIPVYWKGAGGEFLGILSIPYNILHPLAIIMTYGAIFFLAKRQFYVRTEKGVEKTQYKSVYSNITNLPSSGELKKKSELILITATPINDPTLIQRVDKGWHEIQNGETLRSEITGKMSTLSKVSKNTGLSIDEIYLILDKLTYELDVPFQKVITLLHREFSYSFEEVTIDSLHVMMLDGRAVLSHTFGEESQVEPALVAGLFSAITSFAKEAVRSEQLLKTIDHGDVVLTIEYQRHVFAAIFADSTSTELRKKLSEFLTDFENRYSKVLPTWLGDLDVFKKDIALIDQVFTS